MSFEKPKGFRRICHRLNPNSKVESVLQWFQMLELAIETSVFGVIMNPAHLSALPAS